MSQVCFIINPTSGGGRGARLAEELSTLGGGAQVFILGRCDLVAIVAALEPADVVVACGGDGTASAVAGLLAERGARAPCLGVVPLGTGNDLARTLGWAGRRLSPSTLAVELRAGVECRLDCWTLSGPTGRRTWCNYLSLGIDARVAHRFHHLRLRHPRLISGAGLNRALYALLGAQQRGTDLVRQVRLPDGPRLPPWASVLVLCNIPSYAGGAKLAEDMHCGDGRLEAVAMGHGVSLGLATGRLRRPRLLQRLAGVTIEVGNVLAMQVDGEPFAAPRGRYRVAHAGTIRVLAAGGSPCAT